MASNSDTYIASALSGYFNFLAKITFFRGYGERENIILVEIPEEWRVFLCLKVGNSREEGGLMRNLFCGGYNQPCIKTVTVCLPLSPFLSLCNTLFLNHNIVNISLVLFIIFYTMYIICIYLYVFYMYFI